MLTRTENHVLGLVMREQPVTAYRIRELVGSSIVANFRSSNGTIYPLLRRLVDRGVLTSRKQIRNKRSAEVYRCTKTGRDAVRAWIQAEDGEELVLEDPVRTKLLAMSVLEQKEQIAWLRRLHERLQSERTRLEEFIAEHADLEYAFFAHDNARSTLTGRIEWVARTLRQLERDERNAKA